jgi:very-short-patch-repair endonuclease
MLGNNMDAAVARVAQRYVTDLLEQLLGPCEKEKRFDWARGDSRTPSGKGVPLPFDAVWESRRLIVEIDERQHDESVDFFDKPSVMTVSGVSRGEQRRLYDERKVRLAGEHGYAVVRIPTRRLSRGFRDRASDLSAISERLRDVIESMEDRG